MQRHQLRRGAAAIVKFADLLPHFLQEAEGGQPAERQLLQFRLLFILQQGEEQVLDPLIIVFQAAGLELFPLLGIIHAGARALLVFHPLHHAFVDHRAQRLQGGFADGGVAIILGDVDHQIQDVGLKQAALRRQRRPPADAVVEGGELLADKFHMGLSVVILGADLGQQRQNLFPLGILFIGEFVHGW